MMNAAIQTMPQSQNPAALLAASGAQGSGGGAAPQGGSSGAASLFAVLFSQATAAVSAATDGKPAAAPADATDPQASADVTTDAPASADAPVNDPELALLVAALQLGTAIPPQSQQPVPQQEGGATPAGTVAPTGGSETAGTTGGIPAVLPQASADTGTTLPMTEVPAKEASASLPAGKDLGVPAGVESQVAIPTLPTAKTDPSVADVDPTPAKGDSTPVRVDSSPVNGGLPSAGGKHLAVAQATGGEPQAVLPTEKTAPAPPAAPLPEAAVPQPAPAITDAARSAARHGVASVTPANGSPLALSPGNQANEKTEGVQESRGIKPAGPRSVNPFADVEVSVKAKGDAAQTDDSGDDGGGDGTGREQLVHTQLTDTAKGTDQTSSPQPAAEAKQLPQHESILAQVRSGLAEHAGKKEGEISLRLSPADLGDLKINIRMDDQRLRVDVVASNPHVKDVLMQNLPALKEALSRQNLTMTAFDVSSGTGQGSQNAFQNGREPGQRQGYDPFPFMSAGSQTTAEIQPVQWRGRADALVDLRL